MRLHGSRIATFTMVATIAATTSGCFLAGHSSSPWEWGVGGRIAPSLVDLGSAGSTTFHPLVGYTYLSFDGGHDGLFEFGGQVRHRLSLGSGSMFWLGGEGGLAHVRSSYDAGAVTIVDSATGPMFGVLGGVPIGQSRWGVNAFGGFGITRFEGNTGKNIRLGVDLQPWFFQR